MYNQAFPAFDADPHANGAGARRNGTKQTGSPQSEGEPDAKLQSFIAEAASILAEPNEQFEKLLSEYRVEFLPIGPHQNMLVRELAVSDWRLRQIDRIQMGLQWFQMSEIHSSACRPDIQVRWDETPRTPVPASISGASDDLRTLLMGAAWLENAKLFALLVRYQNNARRDYYRALKQLEQVRTGKAAYLPSKPDQTNETKPANSTAPSSRAAAAGVSSSPNQTNPTPDRTPTLKEPALPASAAQTNPTSTVKRAG